MTNKGWRRESKRHSLAARGVKTYCHSSQKSICSFSSPTRAEQVGKQIGDMPFKLSASTAQNPIEDFHRQVLSGTNTSYHYRVEMMLVEDFIQKEYDLVKEQDGFFVSPPPDINRWANINNEAVIEYSKRMSSGELAPAPTIDKFASGETWAIDGKHRALAAKRLGCQFIPVIVFTEKAKTETL